MPVERMLYQKKNKVPGKSMALSPLCANCGLRDGEVDKQLLLLWKSVLPQCVQCKQQGIKISTATAIRSAQASKRRSGQREKLNSKKKK